MSAKKCILDTAVKPKLGPCQSQSGQLAKKSKAFPLHAMEAHRGRGGIAPTHS
jgi:hypothetical protein